MFMQLIKGGVCTIRVLIGFVVYLISGKTPIFAHHGLVGLFCLSGGKSNDLLSALIGLFKRPYKFLHAEGLLGDMSAKRNRDFVVERLRTRGFHVFDERVPQVLCDRLLKYALSQPCKTRLMDDGKLIRDVSAQYPRGTPEAVRYDFDAKDLLDNDDVQRLLADLSFAAIAQDYLGSRPVVDVLGMWWHTDFSKAPDSEAAQFFHFDMDRPKWLKFFIYLTDVTEESGPHLFVAGSQRTNGIPANLLSKGYSRLLDDEIAREFNEDDIIEFVAPQGTIIAEDTRGLHKGKHVECGDRLVLQIQFSNCLFGGIYPDIKINKNLCPELKLQVLRFPALYSAYVD